MRMNYSAVAPQPGDRSCGRMQTGRVPENPAEKKPGSFSVKDPGSALTHLIGFVAAIVLTPPLLIHAHRLGASSGALWSLTIFMSSMILLYGASTAYHTFDRSPGLNTVLKRLDHLMIFVLIAGTYTPMCVIAFPGTAGRRLLILVWSIAVVGMLVKFFWIHCPKWVSSILYISMGWCCLTVFPVILRTLSLPAFLWLLAGGVMYTIGGVVYALKLKAFNNRYPNFGSHEIFHLFVMAGSACHYIVAFFCLTY